MTLGDTDPASDASAPYLTVRDLSYSYSRNGEELFGGLDHDFDRSSLTAITGVSGRGKSTLLYVLGLLLRPARGRVYFDGGEVHALPDAERSLIRASRIGFVFQDSALDPTRNLLDAVTEPALYSGKTRLESRERAMALLEELGLSDRASHRPGQISGGQAQRTAVARALINDPDVILADEPTGNLDEANAESVLGHLRRVASSGRTVVLATHDSRVLDHADHVLRL
jgi:ABC-type lipoprotein export system ATPase subunit